MIQRVTDTAILGIFSLLFDLAVLALKRRRRQRAPEQARPSLRSAVPI